MTHAGHVVDLRPHDAWSLLPDSGLGRLLYTKFALPVVRLLPFRLRGHAMVLPFDDTTWEEIHHVIGSVAAVEVDDLLHGWSVTVTSVVREVKASEEDLNLDPTMSRWLDGVPIACIELEPAVVAGQLYQVCSSCDRDLEV